MMNIYNYFSLHPATIIVLSVIALICANRSWRIHTMLTIVASAISGYMLYELPVENIFQLFGVSISYSGSVQNKIIGAAFLIILFTANINSIAHNRYSEVIFGSLYGACAIICLLASDFVSMFVALELMAVFSSIIIFMGGRKDAFLAAKKYFITHLLSSNMILVTIIHVFMVSKSFEIIEIGDILGQTQYSAPILLIGLIGLLINVAVPPVSGWMINYYPSATSSGFIYLISFTTKLSVMLIFKLFAGCELLKYAGIVMIIHSCLKVIFEEENMRILCYFSIISMGFMLIGLSAQNSDLQNLAIYYLFISILAILTMSLAVSALAESGKGHLIFMTGLFTGLSTLLAVPGTFPFALKSVVSGYFKADGLIYGVILFSVFIIGFAFPWKRIYYQYFKNCSSKIAQTSRAHLLCISSARLPFISKFNSWIIGSSLNASKVTAASSENLLSQFIIIITSILTIICTIFGDDILRLDLEEYSGHTFQQIIIILSSLILGLTVNYKRFITRPISIIEWFGDIIFWLSKYQQKSKSSSEEEVISLNNVEFQWRKFLCQFHNQQTAIAIVFILLTVLLFMLIIPFNYY